MKSSSKYLVILAVLLSLFSGCASTTHYRMDGLVPYEAFQAEKAEGERLVSFVPVLEQHHRFNNLYIITNPEDIEKAGNVFNNPGVLPLLDTERMLHEFSPVKIQSTNDKPVGLSEQVGEGIGIFSLPESVKEFFYVYIRYRNDTDYTSDYSTEIFSGIMPLPSGSSDVLIAFHEQDNKVFITPVSDPEHIVSNFNSIMGLYGWYLATDKNRIKPQAGFILYDLDYRMNYARAHGDRRFQDNPDLGKQNRRYVFEREK